MAQKFPCRNGSTRPNTAENGSRNGSAIVTKSLLSPNIRCCGRSWVRNEDMSAEIVYSLNKIVHSSNEITYNTNQSAHPMNVISFSSNENMLSWIENASQLGKDVRLKYTMNLTVSPHWCWWFSRGETTSVTVVVPQEGLIMGGQIWHDSPASVPSTAHCLPQA